MVFPVMAAMALGSAAASVYGGRQANKANKAMAAQQEALQREFAQQGIRWKVADAKAAGLHPLYAIGAQGAQYSPVSYSDSMGPAIAQAGQQLSSAAGQYIDYKNQQRVASEQRQLAQDQIILGQQRLRSQIHVDTAQANYYNAMAAQALRQPSSGFGDANTGLGSVVTDPATIAAQQNSGAVVVNPKELTPNEPGSPSIEAGRNSLWVVEKAGMGMHTVRLNDKAAEAWGDVAAPVINAAATAFFYTFDHLPNVTKQNYQWLVNWYKNDYMKRVRKDNPKTSKLRGHHTQPAPRPRTLKTR